MSIVQALIAEVRLLTPQQQEVLNFAAFLRQRNPIEAEASTAKVSTPGLHKDAPYWMTEDFDASLLDSFWPRELRDRPSEKPARPPAN